MVHMIGQIALFAGSSTPRGWKRCDGSILVISEFRALFEIIGSTYGGDGLTTFGLPDLGGRYMVCAQGARPNLRPEPWSEILPPGQDSPIQYVQSVTYAELMTLIDDELLVPGKQYLITDFAARWFAVSYYLGTDSISTVSDSAQTGNIEPLLVLARSADSLYLECKSSIYNGDVIFYEVDPSGYAEDPFYSDGAGYISGLKGIIARRIDTINNIDAPFDWRNLTFRRWAVDPPAWSSATAYSLGDAVVSGGFMYACIQSHTNQTPSSAVTYWQKMLSADLSIDPYWSLSPDHFYYTIGIPFYCPVSGAYEDYKVFGGFAVKNVKIGTCEILSALNSVFKQSDDYQSGNFGIGAGSYNNTIGEGFLRNSIDCNFHSNLIGPGFSDNLIASNCWGNFLLESFSENQTSPRFVDNLIGADCKYNRFGVRFTGNNTKAGFTNNRTGYSIGSKDYTGATHVYNLYDCTISKSADGTVWLTYVNDSGVLTTVSHTT